MKRGPTGRFEVGVLGGEEVSAFITDSLPPPPSLELPPKRQRLLARAQLARGRFV